MVCTCGLYTGCEDHGGIKLPIRIKRLSGRCSSGAERGSGNLWHAVSGHSALCGAKPGRNSAGWQANEGMKVTCTKCLRKISKQKSAAVAQEEKEQEACDSGQFGAGA